MSYKNNFDDNVTFCLATNDTEYQKILLSPLEISQYQKEYNFHNSE